MVEIFLLEPVQAEILFTNNTKINNITRFEQFF